MRPAAELTDEAEALKRYAITITRDMSEAEDLVQDCMERALRKWSLRKADVPLRPWLFRMMRNLHVSRWRKMRRHRYNVSIDDTIIDPALPARQEGHVDLNNLLVRVMALPDDQRAALVLVSIEGFTYSEAGKVLGVPEGTIMSRVSRARARLRDTPHPVSRPKLRTVK